MFSKTRIERSAIKSMINNCYNKTSQTISIARFPLAIMVVIIHSRTLNDPMPPLNLGDISGVDIAIVIQTLFSKVVSPMAIAAFYIISGYLFFYNIDSFSKKIYFSKLRKRVHSLAVPYLIWNAIYILWLFIKEIVKSARYGDIKSVAVNFMQQNFTLTSFWDCNLWGLTETNWIGQTTLPNGPILIPLWFMRDLMVVVLLTPIIYFLIRRLKVLFLVILLFCYMSGVWPYIHGFSIVSVFFFSIGAFFSINNKDMVKETWQVRFLPFVLYIPLTIIMLVTLGDNSELHDVLNTIYTLISACVLFNISSLISNSRLASKLIRLQGYSVFIYCAHSFIGFTIANMILRLVSIGNYEDWLSVTISYFMRIVIAVFVCVYLQKLLEKYCPKSLWLLIGKKS